MAIYVSDSSHFEALFFTPASLRYAKKTMGNFIALDGTHTRPNFHTILRAIYYRRRTLDLFLKE
jgi:hypothetical protein